MKLIDVVFKAFIWSYKSLIGLAASKHYRIKRCLHYAAVPAMSVTTAYVSGALHMVERYAYIMAIPLVAWLLCELLAVGAHRAVVALKTKAELEDWLEDNSLQDWDDVKVACNAIAVIGVASYVVSNAFWCILTISMIKGTNATYASSREVFIVLSTMVQVVHTFGAYWFVRNIWFKEMVLKHVFDRLANRVR